VDPEHLCAGVGVVDEIPVKQRFVCRYFVALALNNHLPLLDNG